MRCKGEEDIIIWVSFRRIPMYVVCEHKLCSLCVHSQEFKSRGITTWTEEANGLTGK